MSDLYSTETMMAIIEDLKRPSTFLLNTFFPDVSTFDTEAVAIDFLKGTRRMAPFVSPEVEGKFVIAHGRTTKTVEPAYVKSTGKLNPRDAVKRAVGERIGGGEFTPEERQMLNLERNLQDHIGMLNLRFEHMAADALLDGKQTIAGEGFETVQLDYKRNAGNTVTLVLTTRWGEEGVSPAADIKTWNTQMLKASGITASDIVFTPEARDLWEDDPKVQNSIDTRRGGQSEIELGPLIAEGGAYVGKWGQFRIWEFNGWYLDEDGNEQRLLPEYTVLMGSLAVEGTRYFGAILDDETVYPSVEYYPKSWTTPNPGRRHLMLQSAPIVAPLRPDASFTATVR